MANHNTNESETRWREQDPAEQLDDDVIRMDDAGAEEQGLPGVNAYSDRGPMHSEDPNLLLGGSETRDEIHTREWRERDEELPEDLGRPVGDRASGDPRDLIDPAGATNSGVDVEKQLIGDESMSSHDGTTVPAEVAAVTVDEPQDR